MAPNATVQGDVILKPGSTVWYGAVLRGDDGTLTLGENSNVQDNAVLHCDVGGAVTLGRSVTVGHSAVVHGCTVGDGTLIGMHATLLNHCVIREKLHHPGPGRWCRKGWSSRTVPWPSASRRGSSRPSPPNRLHTTSKMRSTMSRTRKITMLS